MQKSLLDGRFGWLLNFSIVVGTLATIPVVVMLDQGDDSPWLHAADWAIWTVFLIEYVVELTLSRSHSGYAKKNWLSPIVLVLSFPLIPDLLGSVRLVRLVRFLRFSRLAGVTFRGLSELRAVVAHRGLLYVGITTCVLILAGGAALEIVEPKTVRGGFFDGIWWAIVTASTVGYGDIAPATFGGRAIAVILMLSGIGLISTFSASVTSYFVGQQEAEGLKDMQRRLERMERLLEELAAREGSPRM